jgi:hypothetical protein
MERGTGARSLRGEEDVLRSWQAVAVVLLLVAVSTSDASLPASASPTVELRMDVVPEHLELFPTYAQFGTLELMGSVTCDKARPDEVRVYIEAWADVDWEFWVEPSMMVFRGVGEYIFHFDARLSVPPRTAGPPVVNMYFRAYADLISRTVECTDQSTLHIIQDVEGFVEAFPSEITVATDRGVSGTASLENMLGEDLQVHISATGDWDALIPDLDFQQYIVLRPYEQRRASFYGRLSSSVEPGKYDVEMALWTPEDSGERTVITTVNVTIKVMEDPGDTLTDSVMRSLVPIVVLVGAALGLVMYWYLRRRDQAEARDHNR